MSITIRAARQDDARTLARIIDIAGHGLPAYLWKGMASANETPLDVGTERAARSSGGFSWRNAHLAVTDGQIAGGLIGYRLGEDPQPIDDLPAMFRPLQALENRVPGSYYINALACFEAFRQSGVGLALLAQAEALGATAKGISLIVSDTNQPALKLYRRRGFVEMAREPLVRNGWRGSGQNWVLMTKPTGRFSRA